MDLAKDTESRFLWVLDFPMFEKDAQTGALGAVHHPFTSPMPEDVHLLESAPERARAQAPRGARVKAVHP